MKKQSNPTHWRFSVDLPIEYRDKFTKFQTTNGLRNLHAALRFLIDNNSDPIKDIKQSIFNIENIIREKQYETTTLEAKKIQLQKELINFEEINRVRDIRLAENLEMAKDELKQAFLDGSYDWGKGKMDVDSKRGLLNYAKVVSERFNVSVDSLNVYVEQLYSKIDESPTPTVSPINL